jgi:hypothetical protein
MDGSLCIITTRNSAASFWQPHLAAGSIAMPSESGKVRWALVGLGHIAQVAVLPAFRHAAENSELVALVSSEPELVRVEAPHD